MNEYDVIIVGAGPAGSSAAKITAAQGLRTVVLEEHTSIGTPDHCSGILFATTRPELTEEILGSMGRRIIVRQYAGMRVFAPSGKVVAETSLAGKSAYIIQRDNFDRELARQAVKAGAGLALNTRVTGLLKKEGRITGVITTSKAMPEISGRIVIGTDGIYAVQKGVPRWSGLVKDDVELIGGISFELAKLTDIEPDIYEFHTGAFSRKGWTSIFPRDDSSCMTHFLSMAEFEGIKKGNYAFSKKAKDAVPVKITGWNHPANLGVGLPRSVADGLILAGSAANLIAIIPAIISGRHAGKVAVEALREGDVSTGKLACYDDLIKSLKAPRGFKDGFPFYGKTDEEIEKILLDMLARDEFPRTRPMPL